MTSSLFKQLNIQFFNAPRNRSIIQYTELIYCRTFVAYNSQVVIASDRGQILTYLESFSFSLFSLCIPIFLSLIFCLLSPIVFLSLFLPSVSLFFLSFFALLFSVPSSPFSLPFSLPFSRTLSLVFSRALFSVELLCVFLVIFIQFVDLCVSFCLTWLLLPLVLPVAVRFQNKLVANCPKQMLRTPQLPTTEHPPTPSSMPPTRKYILYTVYIYIYILYV